MNWLQRLLQGPQNMLAQPQSQPSIPMMGQPMDNASMRVAQAAGTPNPNMAPMPGGMAAPQQQAQQPGMMDRFKQFRDGDGGKHLADIFAGWAMGATPSQSLGMGAAFAREGKSQRKGTAKEQDRLNQTVEYLKGQGLDPDSAALVASDPKTLQEFLKQMLAPEGSGAVERGLNPQYGVDAQGNPVLIQLGKDGTAVQTALPEGVSLSKEPIRFDAGTHFVLLDPITRQPVGQIPKENFEAARDTAAGSVTGKAEAEAKIDLGGSLQKADQSLALIDQMLAHPGLETATGLSSVLDPRNYLAGTDATNFNVMRKQLEGKAFLEAFESLKGGGQITEIEGQKATEAIARLSTAQSEAAYKEALNELKGILETGKNNIRKKAGVEQVPAQAAPAAQPRTPISEMTDEELEAIINGR